MDRVKCLVCGKVNKNWTGYVTHIRRVHGLRATHEDKNHEFLPAQRPLSSDGGDRKKRKYAKRKQQLLPVPSGVIHIPVLMRVDFGTMTVSIEEFKEINK